MGRQVAARRAGSQRERGTGAPARLPTYLSDGSDGQQDGHGRGGDDSVQTDSSCSEGPSGGSEEVDGAPEHFDDVQGRSARQANYDTYLWSPKAARTPVPVELQGDQVDQTPGGKDPDFKFKNRHVQTAMRRASTLGRVKAQETEETGGAEKTIKKRARDPEKRLKALADEHAARDATTMLLHIQYKKLEPFLPMQRERKPSKDGLLFYKDSVFVCSRGGGVSRRGAPHSGPQSITESLVICKLDIEWTKDLQAEATERRAAPEERCLEVEVVDFTHAFGGDGGADARRPGNLESSLLTYCRDGSVGCEVLQDGQFAYFFSTVRTASVGSTTFRLLRVDLDEAAGSGVQEDEDLQQLAPEEIGSYTIEDQEEGRIAVSVEFIRNPTRRVYLGAGHAQSPSETEQTSTKNHADDFISSQLVAVKFVRDGELIVSIRSLVQFTTVLAESRFQPKDKIRVLKADKEDIIQSFAPGSAAVSDESEMDEQQKA